MAVPDLLLRLLGAAGPAGSEGRAAAVWRDAAAELGDVERDALGNSVVRVGGGGPLVAVVGHIDEIGFTVTHVGDDGLLGIAYVAPWPAQVALGQRVTVLARGGDVPGVIAGRSERHVEQGERGRTRWDDLHLDIGARDGDEARALVRPGDVGVVATEPLLLRDGRLTGRALDNRLGAWLALEIARRHASAGASVDVAAVASVQEEVGHHGAATAAYALRPAAAIVLDVTYATDIPGEHGRKDGHRPLGSGPSIMRGPTLSPYLTELLLETAEREGIPHTIEVGGGRTSTDADHIHLSRAGIPTALVSVPLRYMHSPVELCDLGDVEGCARVVAAALAAIPADAPLAR